VKNKGILVVVVALCTALLVTACAVPTPTPVEPTPAEPTPAPSPEPEPTEKVVKIGYVGPCSGPLSFLGNPMTQGAQIAVDMCNDAGGINIGGEKYRVELLTWDCRGETQPAIAGATHFVEEGCLAVFTCFGTQIPLQAVTEPNKVILSTCGGADETQRPGIDYTFSFEGPSNTIEPWGEFYTRVLNVKKMAVLTENQEFSVARHDVFVPEWEKRGTEIVFDEMFESDCTDFYTILSKVKDTSPDALFLNAYGTNALKVFQQRLEIGYPVQLFTFNQLTCIGPEAWRLVGTAGEGLIEEIWHYPLAWEEEPEEWAVDLIGFDPDLRAEFIKIVADRHGKENISACHGLSYDMVYAFLENLRMAGSLDPDDIVAAYESETPHPGVLFDNFYWKDSHRILVPRGLGRYTNIDPEAGTADLEFLQVAKFLDANGSTCEIHELSTFDVQAYRAELGY